MNIDELIGAHRSLQGGNFGAQTLRSLSTPRFWPKDLAQTFPRDRMSLGDCQDRDESR